MSELQRCCVAVRQLSAVNSESEAGLLVGTSMASMWFNIIVEMYVLKACTCIYTNPYLTPLMFVHKYLNSK